MTRPQAGLGVIPGHGRKDADALEPACARCSRRHRPELPCWKGRHVALTTRLVLEAQGDVCWLCGRHGATTADHVVPRSRGGGDELGNLRPAHGVCNSRRQDRAPFTPERAPRRSPARLSPLPGVTATVPSVDQTKEHT